jgi:hypothetical protein
LSTTPEVTPVPRTGFWLRASEALAALDLAGFRKNSRSPEVTVVAYELHIRERVRKMRIEKMRLA